MKKLKLVPIIAAVMALQGLTGCVSGAKRLAQVELAATNPPELERLCREGISGACTLQGKTVVMPPALSIMQGLTSSQQSRFTVMLPRKQKAIYFARGAKGLVKLASERVERASSPMAVDQVEAFGLDPKDDYELIVIDGEGMAIDRRRFRALDTSKRNPHLILISCMDDSLKTEQAAMWKQLLAEKPDAILMIGDNVYADRIPGGWQVASGEQLWDRYVDTRDTLEFYKAADLVPVVATWDDHDYGRNDADRTYPLKEESAKVFQAFFNQTKPTGELARGPGVSSMWQVFGLRFLLLDDRSFRSPNRTDLPDQSHFGPEQEEWIASNLTRAQEPVFLVSGDQFFGGYHPFESFEGSHPKNFRAQLARWKKAKAPVVFLSGDRHLSEIIQVPNSRLGYRTYELTSSPLHATVFPGAFAKNPSPDQIAGVDGKYNYMILDVVKSGPRLLQMNVRSRGLNQTTLYQKSLTVKK